MEGKLLLYAVGEDLGLAVRCIYSVVQGAQGMAIPLIASKSTHRSPDGDLIDFELRVPLNRIHVLQKLRNLL